MNKHIETLILHYGPRYISIENIKNPNVVSSGYYHDCIKELLPRF